MPRTASPSAGSSTTTPPRKRSGTRTRRAAAPGVDAAQRASMIAEAAYFRAAERDFDGGDPVADWLAAEKDIERRLNGG